MKALSGNERLRMQLQFAGVPNLKDEALARYMEMEAARYTPNWIWRANAYLRGNFEIAAFCTIAIPVSVGLLGDQAIVNSMTFPVTIIAWAAAVVMFLSIAKEVGPAEWNIYRLKPNYRGYYSSKLDKLEEVPSFIAERALLIQALIPEAGFEVAALEQERTSLDPVLYLIVGDIRIPVDIWKGEDRVLLS